MPPIVIAAVVAILLAATIYTIAVFAEFRARTLKPWHLALFWLGLVFDTIGTTLMSKIAGGFELNIHGALGVLAIVLMLVHAGWATFVMLSKRTEWLKNFHHFSLTVWSVWMVSLVTGFALAIPAMMSAGGA
jgi:uncharacterized repeat protein (TIGR03987 family)